MNISPINLFRTNLRQDVLKNNFFRNSNLHILKADTVSFTSEPTTDEYKLYDEEGNINPKANPEWIDKAILNIIKNKIYGQGEPTKDDLKKVLEYFGYNVNSSINAKDGHDKGYEPYAFPNSSIYYTISNDLRAGAGVIKNALDIINTTNGELLPGRRQNMDYDVFIDNFVSMTENYDSAKNKNQYRAYLEEAKFEHERKKEEEEQGNIKNSNSSWLNVIKSKQDSIKNKINSFSVSYKEIGRQIKKLENEFNEILDEANRFLSEERLNSFKADSGIDERIEEFHSISQEYRESEIKDKLEGFNSRQKETEKENIDINSDEETIHDISKKLDKLNSDLKHFEKNEFNNLKSNYDSYIDIFKNELHAISLVLTAAVEQEKQELSELKEQVTGNIDEMQKKYTKLTSRIQSITKKFDDSLELLNLDEYPDLTDKKTKINEKITRLSQIQSDIGEEQNKLTGYKEAIASDECTKEEINAINKKANNKKDTITNKENEINTIEKEINDLEAEIVDFKKLELEDYISALESNIQKEILNTETKISIFKIGYEIYRKTNNELRSEPETKLYSDYIKQTYPIDEIKADVIDKKSTIERTNHDLKKINGKLNKIHEKVQTIQTINDLADNEKKFNAIYNIFQSINTEDIDIRECESLSYQLLTTFEEILVDPKSYCLVADSYDRADKINNIFSIILHNFALNRKAYMAETKKLIDVYNEFNYQVQ